MEDYKRVAVDEAIRLMGRQTVDVFYYVVEVVQATAQREAAAFPTRDVTFNLMMGAFAAWEAGRVAGIRAERARRKTGHK